MKLKILFVAFFMFPKLVNATEFKLGMLQHYGSVPNSIELGLVSDKTKISGSSISFENLMSLLMLASHDLHIRILPGLSEPAKIEILNFYRANLPAELEAAKRSKGNLHNPAIQPLVELFSTALKTTAYYKELVEGVKKVGFGSCEVNIEKFTFENGIPSVAELNLVCHKI